VVALEWAVIDRPEPLPQPAHSNWIQMILATPVGSGWLPFFVRGWNSVLTRYLNSSRSSRWYRRRLGLQHPSPTLAPEIFPAAFRIGGGAVAVYFEAAAVITVLVLLDRCLNYALARRRVEPSGHF